MGGFIIVVLIIDCLNQRIFFTIILKKALTIKLGSAIIKLQSKLCKILYEVITVDKEEILKRAQTESVDEGLENARSKSNAYGIMAFLIVYIVITIFNLIKHKSNDIPTIFFMAYLAAESIPEYIFTKKKIFLITSVASGIAAVLDLILYMTGA